MKLLLLLFFFFFFFCEIHTYLYFFKIKNLKKSKTIKSLESFINLIFFR